jgi:plastocyanin
MMRMFVGTTATRATLLGAFAAGAMAIAAASPAAAHDYTVTMANMSYGQIPSGLKVGDTVTWVNKDTVPHTVTARDKSFDVRVNPGQSVPQTLSKAGSFPFFCIFHATMRGVLTVSDK